MIRYAAGASLAPALALALLATTTAGMAQAATSKAPALTAWVSHETDGGPDGYLTPIDTATNTPGAHIRVGSAPRNVVAAINGKTVYALVVGAEPQSPGSLIPISTATHTKGKPIKIAGGDPIADAITPDGKTIYITNAFSDTVTPVTVATGTAGKPIRVGAIPTELAITPDGKTVYVVNLPVNGTAGTVTPISTATNTPGKPIPVGAGPAAIVITPNGKTVYVSNEISDTVTPISTATNTAGKAIKVGQAPTPMVVTPNGKTLYVANEVSPTVTPISTATNTAGKAITLSSRKGYTNNALAIAPDGKTLYAGGFLATSSTSGYLIPVTTATGAVEKAITVASSPDAIAVTPNGATAYVVCAGVPIAGVPGGVTPVNTATDTALKTIDRGGFPTDILLAP
jgi:YVTN family beta-propeller protein